MYTATRPGIKTDKVVGPFVLTVPFVQTAETFPPASGTIPVSLWISREIRYVELLTMTWNIELLKTIAGPETVMNRL